VNTDRVADILLLVIALFEHPVAARRFAKSNELLGFDQTFDPTLGMIELRVEPADGDLF
jgi:hypothetical protein